MESHQLRQRKMHTAAPTLLLIGKQIVQSVENSKSAMGSRAQSHCQQNSNHILTVYYHSMVQSAAILHPAVNIPTVCIMYHWDKIV